MLSWRTLVPSNAYAYNVKSTEIDVTIPPGFRSRFAIYGVRCYVFNPDWRPGSIADPQYHASMHYRVKDDE